MNPIDRSNTAGELSHDLCANDARAMEALCEAGFDCARVPAEMRGRAERCAAVLGLLGCGPAPTFDESLIDATLVRVLLARRAQESDLAPREEDALEALVAAGFDPARCPMGVRKRATAHAAVLAHLDVRIDTSDRDALVNRTLGAVQSSIESGQERMRLDPAQGRARMSFRWADMVSVAALLLIASAVIVPMVGAVRGMSHQSGCEAGLARAFAGFTSYANDYRESLPLASASPAGSRWLDIGQAEHSNSANLFTLLREKYTQSGDLACPGNATACRGKPAPGAMDWSCSDAISYSYQNQFAPERVNFNQPKPFIVLADRSPVMVRVLRREWFNPMANSDNHQGRGQKALYSNGSVVWMKTPVTADGDNIWLPKPFEEAIAKAQNPTRAEPLRGTETPAGKRDSFLTP